MNRHKNRQKLNGNQVTGSPDESRGKEKMGRMRKTGAAIFGRRREICCVSSRRSGVFETGKHEGSEENWEEALGLAPSLGRRFLVQRQSWIGTG